MKRRGLDMSPCIGRVPNKGRYMAKDSNSYPMDTKDHQKTYAGFLTLMKWGTIVSLILAAIVVIILVS